MQENEDDPHYKLKKTIELFFKTQPTNIDETVEFILWFYSCGKYNKNNKNDKGNSQRQYSFSHDSDHIFSAFWQCYRIDLNSTNLHWWKFRALFNSLPEDRLMSKILYYRTVEINSNMSKSEKERIQRLKDIYRLPLLKSEQQKLDKIEKALMSDGDLSKLL